MSKDYIPNNNSEFMSFQAYLSGQVAANATVWNVPAAEATALANWSAGFEPLFLSIVNKNTRSREQVIAYDEYKADYVAFLRPFCQGFLVNNTLIPISERVAMGLNPRGLNPRSQRPAITTAPIVELRPLSGGLVRFGFKVEASNTRSARQPDSNGVEVYYKLLSQVNKLEPIVVLEDSLEPPADNGVNTGADAGLPTSGYQQMFSTRARFVHQLPMADIGKTLHVYARWVNTSDATKNGPYSMVSTTVVA